MKTNLIILTVLLTTTLTAYSQVYYSIQQQENEKYKAMSFSTEKEWDNYNNYTPQTENRSSGKAACKPNKIVYGWHPYWMGTAYNQYDFEALTHVAYFGYEINPNTGSYTDLHNWRTTDLVPLAKQAGVKVHLTAILFSGHGTFFGSQQAQNTLIDSLVSLVKRRNADGVNIDFEALSATYRQPLTNFMIALSQRFHTEIPGSEVTIAISAVDWDALFDVETLSKYLDFFVIMGYDYHWTSSPKAGPVAPKNSGSVWEPYDITRSINYYLNKNVPPEMLCLGVPYYGRDWPTVSDGINVATTTTGTSVTYDAAVDFARTYGRRWEPQSSNPYYAYYTGSSWRQCWYDDAQSLGLKYDVVNMQKLGGIGIWALGYDGRRTELWELIKEKFSECAFTPCEGNFTDMGGAHGNYYPNEKYEFAIQPTGADKLVLTFDQLNLGAGDTLRLYEETLNPRLLATFTAGASLPSPISANHTCTFSFVSDNANQGAGWSVNWNCSSLPATTVIASEWETASFLLDFVDQAAVDKPLVGRYYLIEEFDGLYWKANTLYGMLSDDFMAPLTRNGWQTVSGAWKVENNTLIQSDEAAANTNLYVALPQQNNTAFVYEWEMKISGTGNNRRAGIQFYTDNANAANRGNGYMVYFRPDWDKVELYRVENDQLLLKTNDDVVLEADTWYTYRIVHNTATGHIQAYVNGILVSEFTDPTPPLAEGKFLSLRTGNCRVNYDSFKVYALRTTDQISVSLGNATTDLLHYTNTQPSLPACKVSSMVVDNSYKWSIPEYRTINIDTTAPFKPAYLYDGNAADIDELLQNDHIEANWGVGSDTQSGIQRYWFAVGTSPAATDIIDWTSTDTRQSALVNNLNLPLHSTLYVAVKAENNAGLLSDVATSNGQTVSRITHSTNMLVQNQPNVYPNPFTNQIYIEFSPDSEKTWVQLFDLQGKCVFQQNTDSGEIIAIPAENLAKGIYLLKINNQRPQSVVLLKN